MPPERKKQRTTPKSEKIQSEQPEQYTVTPLSYNLVVTTAPKIFSTKFSRAFATNTHLYVFYLDEIEHLGLKLARLCKESHTWQTLHASFNFIWDIHSAVVLWDQKTVLFFGSSRMFEMNLNTLAMKQHKLQGMSQEMPEDEMDLIFNVLRETTRVEWLCCTVDEQNKRIFALASVKMSWESGEHKLYSLDWNTLKWSCLTLVQQPIPLPVAPAPAADPEVVPAAPAAAPGERGPEGGQQALSILLKKAVHIAYWNEQLFIVLKKFVRSDRLQGPVYTCRYLLRVNLETMEIDHLDTRPLTGTRLLPQNRFKFSQVGSTLYGVFVQRTITDSFKNELWALSLSSLKWTRLSDGRLERPMGKVVVCSSQKEVWVMYRDPEYRPSEEVVAYHIPIAIPSLHSIAKGAFFHRPPIGLVYPKKGRTRISTRKHYYKQLRNIRHTKSWLMDNEISPEIFNFTKEDDNTPTNDHP